MRSETGAGRGGQRPHLPLFPSHSRPLPPCVTPRRREEGQRQHRGRAFPGADATSCGTREMEAESPRSGPAFPGSTPTFISFPAPSQFLRLHHFLGSHPDRAVCSLNGRQMGLNRAEGYLSMHQAAKTQQRILGALPKHLGARGTDPSVIFCYELHLPSLSLSFLIFKIACSSNWLYFIYLFIFHWRIVALQYCVSLYHTAK